MIFIETPIFTEDVQRLLDRGNPMAKHDFNFNRLLESVTQMDEIVRGERAPSREFHVDAVKVKEIRNATGLSQQKFAKLIDVQVGTLRNWEQGRRDPTGPARALLRAINADPKHVLKALAADNTPKKAVKPKSQAVRA
jgi:putative transcriptional regulator